MFRLSQRIDVCKHTVKMALLFQFICAFIWSKSLPILFIFLYLFCYIKNMYTVQLVLHYLSSYEKFYLFTRSVILCFHNLIFYCILIHRIAAMLNRLITQRQIMNCISVVATASSVLKLNSHLVASRGVHVFKTILDIPELDKVSRLLL